MLSRIILALQVLFWTAVGFYTMVRGDMTHALLMLLLAELNSVQYVLKENRN